MSRGFEFLDITDDDEVEVDVEQFDKKSARREKEYKISKPSKYKKKAFKREFDY